MPVIAFLEHIYPAKGSAVGGNHRNPSTNLYYPSRVTTSPPSEKATPKGLIISPHG